MGWKLIAGALRLAALLFPGVAAALVVEIQGVRLEPDMEGASCVDIAGVYPGVRIEGDQPGQTPRVCSNAARVNSIHIANATLVALPPVRREILIKFEHEFPPGVNGKIMARTKLQGFFANEDGVGVPTGDQLNVRTYFVQGRGRDLIAEPWTFTVGDSMESAVFDYSVKKPYLAAGPRALKAELRATFTGLGHKLTLPDRCVVMLDTGSRFEDKLDTLEAIEEGVEEAPSDESTGDGAAPPAGEAPSVPSPGKLPPLPRLPPLNPIPVQP